MYDLSEPAAPAKDPVREAQAVVSVEMDDDATWSVGLAGCGPDEWHRLFAAHLGEDPSDSDDDDDARAGQEAFERALVAVCVVWEQWDEQDRLTPTPGEVADWPAVLPADVWGQLVVAARRLAEPPDISWATERVSRSPRLQLELAAAHHYAVPLSVFRSWTDDDQAYALAWLLETRDRCPGCGVPSRVMLNPDAAHVFVAACEHCREIEATRAELDDGQRGSVHVYASPVRGR